VNTDNINDAFFRSYEASAAVAKKEGKKTNFLDQQKAEVNRVVLGEKKAAQTAVDAAVYPLVKKAGLKAYLNARFSLKQSDRPHLMKF
jgi:large subunit ribosomal protein L6e